MRVCLDTSAYSAFKRGHEQVVGALQESVEIVLSPVVLGELLAGFRGGDREKRNRQELDAFLRSPRVQIAAINTGTSERYAEIHFYLRRQGSPIPTNDLWIAANAMQLGLKILTTDRHFERVPQVTTLLFDG